MTQPSRRCLYIRDYYFRGDEARPWDPAVVEAERQHLAAVSGFDVRFLHFDKMYLDDREGCHLQFLEEVKATKPEFIFYHPHQYPHLLHMNLRPEILFAARELYGPRLVFSFGDLAYDFVAACAAGYTSVGDIAVSWDGSASRLTDLLPGKTVLDLWAPTDGRIFRDPGLDRSIDVCFAGSLRAYEDRQEMITAIQRLGIPVVVRGGDSDDYLSIEDYARLLCESKIALNFSLTSRKVHQIKARVIEATLCGALLFESENDVTSRYLVPYRHYVPFGDAADLAAKIRRYLANEPARKAIVTAAKAHVGKTMSEEVWWGRIRQALDRTWTEVMAKRQAVAPST